MNNILIIGTEPPCPRCGLITKVVTSKVKELNINAEIRHLAYTDLESKAFAKSIGLETGTAKDVANRLHVEINREQLSQIVQNKTQNPDCEFKEYNDRNWCAELDEFLRPFELKAREVGILMTPILVINGEVKHQGSVPGMQKITGWLKELQ